MRKKGVRNQLEVLGVFSRLRVGGRVRIILLLFPQRARGEFGFVSIWALRTCYGTLRLYGVAWDGMGRLVQQRHATPTRALPASFRGGSD